LITLEHDHESSCAGCGGSCSSPPTPPTDEASPLSSRAVVLGSAAFFLGPVLLAIGATAIFDSNGATQFAAAAAGLLGGMAAAWLVGRLFGFSPKERE